LLDLSATPHRIRLDRVTPWKITGRPRRYSRARDGADIDIGWGWTLERAGDERTIRVEVAGGRLTSNALPDESLAAICTLGSSAITPHLDEATPPSRVKVTSAGLFSDYDD
jgi:hypothetical protein